MKKRKIVFLTGTRADFGKLKSLIKISQNAEEFEVNIFATGMHLNKKYGLTVEEISKSGFKNIFKFINHDNGNDMDKILSKTIDGFSNYLREFDPDLIVVHGDRIEALAGAIVGSLNNVLVAHIEGGELSGTIDELIRHAVSKLSHIHLVSNKIAKKRLIQLGEYPNSIHIIGSPDLDLMKSQSLPKIIDVKKYYEIPFNNYAIAILHPVTTEFHLLENQISIFIECLIESSLNYIIIYPNNDLGSEKILYGYKKLASNNKIKIFPSIRFESFLSLLKNAEFIIGNSSTGIREAPFYNIPTIDVGTRQNNRYSSETILNVNFSKNEILTRINEVIKKEKINSKNKDVFGLGKSDKSFLKLIKKRNFWMTSHQKQFQDIT